MPKSQVSERVARQRGGDAAPVTLRFRTWGIDLMRERFGMPARRHTLTRRLLHKLTAAQIYSAAQGMSFAAMQRDLEPRELKLMLVRQQRMMLELAERVMKAGGEPYVVTTDDEQIEPWMLGMEGGGDGAGGDAE